MTDAEPFIDLSAPRHYEQVTAQGRRRRRAAILSLAAVAAVVAGGTGYAAVHRSAEPPIAPVVAPVARPSADPGVVPALGAHPSPGLDPIRRSPAR